MSNLTPVPGAEPRYDDDGNEIMDIVTCGTCGRSWNDAASSGVTPAPSGRCPFEYEHPTFAEERLMDPDTVETALRENVRKALNEYRDFHVTALNDIDDPEPDHHLICKTQIESAQRILWMEKN